MKIAQSIVWTVSMWVSKRKEFVGVSLDALNRSWASFFKGRWCDKALWIKPPSGILKLNFDGSYFHALRWGGIGGEIQDYDGTAIRKYSRPADSLNANEVEVFALLIGCLELLRLDDYNAILQGDSLSTIQWGTGKACNP